MLIPELVNDSPFIKSLGESLKFLIEAPLKNNIKNSWDKALAEGILNLSEWDAEHIENYLRAFIHGHNNIFVRIYLNWRN